MCFLINEKQSRLKIADKDIVCYKRFKYGECLKSATLGVPYVFGRKYEQEPLKRRGMYVDEGYHSYSTASKALKSIYSQLHTVVRCVIPKGSEYYYNYWYSEYVSNRIIIGTENDIVNPKTSKDVLLYT